MSSSRPRNWSQTPISTPLPLIGGDALLWNFTVLGAAAAQLDPTIKERFPEIP